MQYIPGKCNINRDEIVRRYRIGVFGLLITVLGIVAIEALDLPRISRLLIIFPVALSASGFIQAASRFCLAFGFLGVFSSPGPERVQRTIEQEARRLDRLMAIKLLSMVIITSLAISLIYYFFF